MTIKVGDKIPEARMKIMGENGPKDITTTELFSGKKVVLFALPGAFTPTCSAAHLPGFVALADKIKAKGVDDIVCLSVNDVFVMAAWGKSQNAEELKMIADGNGEFTRAVGLELDGSGFGMGLRSQRYAMILEDGKVTALNVEPGPGLEASSAEKIMETLG